MNAKNKIRCIVNVQKINNNNNDIIIIIISQVRRGEQSGVGWRHWLIPPFRVPSPGPTWCGHGWESCCPSSAAPHPTSAGGQLPAPTCRPQRRPSGTGIWRRSQCRRDHKARSGNCYGGHLLDKGMCFHLLQSCASRIPVPRDALKFPEGPMLDLHTWVCCVGFLLWLPALWPACAPPCWPPEG